MKMLLSWMEKFGCGATRNFLYSPLLGAVDFLQNKHPAICGEKVFRRAEIYHRHCRRVFSPIRENPIVEQGTNMPVSPIQLTTILQWGHRLVPSRKARNSHVPKGVRDFS